MKFAIPGLATLLLAANSLFLTPVHASEPLDYDGEYIEHRQAWPEAWSNETVVRHVVKGSMSGLKSLLMDLNEQNAFPEQITNWEDIQQLDAYEDKVLKAIEEMNEWTEKQRDRKGGTLGITDTLPDALFIFIGGKKLFGKKLLLSNGASLSFGIVVMPQKVTRYDVTTGERVPYEVLGMEMDSKPGFSFSVIGWANGDVGFDASPTKAPQKRVGLGYVWDVKDQMVAAGDFAGVGPTGSVNYNFGRMGRNMKFGALSLINKEEELQIPDFIYSTTSWPLVGSRVDHRDIDAGAYLNITGILPWETVSKILGGVIADQVEEINREIEKIVEKAVKDEFKTFTEQGMSLQGIDKIEKDAQNDNSKEEAPAEK